MNFIQLVLLNEAVRNNKITKIKKMLKANKEMFLETTDVELLKKVSEIKINGYNIEEMKKGLKATAFVNDENIIIYEV